MTINCPMCTGRQVISELLLRIRPRYHIFFMMMDDDSLVRTEKKVMTFIFIWKKIIFRVLKYYSADIIKLFFSPSEDDQK